MYITPFRMVLKELLDKTKDPVEDSYYQRLAQVESSNDTTATSPIGAAGLYQFTETTWNDLMKRTDLDYSLEDRYDPIKSRAAVEKFTDRNKAYLTRKLGRVPNQSELYLAHFAGLGGSSKLLTKLEENPNANVNEIIGEGSIKANPTIFLNKDGSYKKVKDIYDWSAKKFGDSPYQAATPSEVKETETEEEVFNPYDILNFDKIKELDTQRIEREKALDEYYNANNNVGVQENHPPMQDTPAFYDPVLGSDPYNYISLDEVQIPRFQDGGSKRDSLNLYKSSQKLFDLFGGDINKIKKYSEKHPNNFTYDILKKDRTPKYNESLGEELATDWISYDDFKENSKSEYFAVKEDYEKSLQYIDYVKSLEWDEEPDFMYHYSPDIVHPSIKPIGEGFDGLALSPIYENPEQKPKQRDKELSIKGFNKGVIEIPVNIGEQELRDIPKGIEKIPYNISIDRPFKMNGKQYGYKDGEIVEVQSREEYRKTHLRPNGKEFQDGGAINEEELAKRVIESRQGVRENPGGDPSTHLMAHTPNPDGEGFIAFPTLFQNEDDTWKELNPKEYIEEEDYKGERGWRQAYERAKQDKEIYTFNTEQEAEEFAKGSWKKYR